jgi:hypothetical protein
MIEKNTALLDIIAPVNVKIKKDSLILGENTTQCFGVISYPQSAKYGWLSELTNIPGTVASISFEPVNSGEFLEHLNKNISVYAADAKEAKNELERLRAEQAMNSGKQLLKRIDVGGEQVGLVSTAIMSFASDIETLGKISRRQKSAASLIKCKERLLSFRQLDAFSQISPTSGKNKNISSMIDRIMPLSSLVYGFPHSHGGYTDDDGYYLGMDGAGGLVILDTWKRSGDRTNSNMVVLGINGTGKSTAVKHIILNEFMLGKRIIIIDPEREYKDMCKACGGDWINAAGGKGKINPLQIKVSSKDTQDDDSYEDNEDDAEEEKLSELAIHLKNLEVFFSLYISSLTDTKLAIIKRSLIELYKKFNIDWDTDNSKLKAEDYPIMEDLYNYVLSEAERMKDEGDDQFKEYEDIARLFEDVAKGGDSFLWNGHTTLKSDAQFVVLDTKDLQDSSERIKGTEYYLLSTWMWAEMSRDRTEKVVGVFDEAYLLIDKRVPQTLAFLRNASKRCRKYEGSMIIISHSVVDFLDESVKMYGQALLDLPTYKFIFGCDGENLKQTKQLYNLNESEEELLLSKQRGQALFFAGSKRMHIDFKIPEYEKEYIGKSGGR